MHIFKYYLNEDVDRLKIHNVNPAATNEENKIKWKSKNLRDKIEY